MGYNGIECDKNLEDRDTFNTEFVSEPNDYEDMKYDYDTAIVVLQGGIVPGYEGPKISSRARIREQAGVIAYLEARLRGENAVMILTGGVELDGYTEAALMKHNLVTKRGIPEEDIIVEEQSYDTSTNAIFTGDILTKLGFKEQGNVKLITNGFHLARSKELFEKYYGGKFEAINAEKYLYENHFDRYLLPGDQMFHPYGLFARKFESSLKNQIFKIIDTTLRYVSKVDLGEMVLGELAKRSRMEKKEKERAKQLASLNK
jgi:hypothetical protein